MRYRDLKQERDDAIARAIEAERLSMKSEFDRVTAEFEEGKQRLQAQMTEEIQEAYKRGFRDGVEAMSNDISLRLSSRERLIPNEH